MGWFHGLKLKLLLILIIGSASLGSALYIGFEIKSEQAQTISMLMEQRIPISEATGKSLANMNGFTRYILSIFVAESVAHRTKRIGQTEDCYKIFLDELAKLKSLKISPKSVELVDALTKRAESLRPVLKDAFAKINENKPESDAFAKEMINQKILTEVHNMTDLFTELDKVFAEHNVTFAKEAKASNEQATHNMQLIAILSSLLFWCFGLSIAVSISKKLKTSSTKMDLSSHEVSKASEQLANASIQLSSSSQEQASALEESSASLQEITGMVESNLRNTEDSVGLAKSVISLTHETNLTIAALTSSMDEIKKSNTKVETLAKLIEEIGEKTDLIDEIVFQTKLLSFNASVEAERAGEHGRGFAVVAQEVGNLAQMSGKSAIEIVSIVKAAIKSAQEVSVDTKARVESGALLCKETATKMHDVTLSTQKILESSEQILRASQEQNSGIQQISKSVESLNKTTQMNAATAEESSTSSSTLFDLSKNLKDQVTELLEIIEGKSNERRPATEGSQNAASKSSAKVVGIKGSQVKSQASPVKISANEVSAKASGGWDSL